MKKIFIKVIQFGLYILMFGLISNIQQAQAQITNPGFETGTLSGWTGSGASVVAGQTIMSWTVNPGDTRMARTEPTSNNASGTETALGLSSGTLSGIASITNLGYLYQDITLTASQTVTVYWNYVSQDYSPYDDGTFGSLTKSGFTQDFKILARTFGASSIGIPPTGAYGSTGWHTVTFTASGAGTYRLGFGSFNWGDQSVSPLLYIDDAMGGTSAPGYPVLTTNAVTNLGGTSATSGGNITSAGTGTITARGICWGTSPAPTGNQTAASPATGTGSFSVNMTSLSPGTTYYVRSYATNSSGLTTYGGDVDFTTPSTSPPTVTTTAIR
jgi:hypothetical protein